MIVWIDTFELFDLHIFCRYKIWTNYTLYSCYLVEELLERLLIWAGCLSFGYIFVFGTYIRLWNVRILVFETDIYLWNVCFGTGVWDVRHQDLRLFVSWDIFRRRHTSGGVLVRTSYVYWPHCEDATHLLSNLSEHFSSWLDGQHISVTSYSRSMLVILLLCLSVYFINFL